MVTCLIPKRGEGVLVTLEMQQVNKFKQGSAAGGTRNDNRQMTDAGHDGPMPKGQDGLPQPSIK